MLTKPVLRCRTSFIARFETSSLVWSPTCIGRLGAVNRESRESKMKTCRGRWCMETFFERWLLILDRMAQSNEGWIENKYRWTELPVWSVWDIWHMCICSCNWSKVASYEPSVKGLNIFKHNMSTERLCIRFSKRHCGTIRPTQSVQHKWIAHRFEWRFVSPALVLHTGVL